MVRRRQQPPPLELPPARLFLDDLEEVIGIFREAQKWADPPIQDQELNTTFQVGDWECDTLDDLRTLGEKTRTFHLEVARPYAFSCWTYIYRDRFAWGSSGLSTEGRWAVYGQLQRVFEKRKLRWYPGLRSVVVFQNSYEYKGFLPSIKRHATKIVVAIVTAVLTFIITKLADKIIRVFQDH